MKKIPLQLSMHYSIQHWALYSPNKVAIADEENETTYKDLYLKILQIQDSLRASIDGQQIYVGVMVANKVDFIAAINAVIAEGHSVVILNQKLDASYVSIMVEDCQCSFIISDDELSGRLNNIKGNVKTIPVESAFNNCKSYDELKNKLSYKGLRFIDNVWGMIYSSGTTGVPKGVIRSDLAMLFELLGWCIELPVLENSTNYISRPLFYTGGLVISGATLLMGGTVLVPKEHSIKSYRDLLNKYETDVAFLIPEEILDLVNEKKITKNSTWPAPKKILTMGAPSTPELKKDIIEHLNTQCIESWGNSEGLGTITKPKDALIRPKSIGRPFLTDMIRILGENHSLVKPNEVGRIAGIADSNFSGYHNLSNLNKKTLIDYEVVSEDLGYMDEDGYFYIVGRTVDRFLYDGMPVYTSDIEKGIYSNKNIKSCKVVAIKDESGKQAPAVVVVLKNGISIQDGKLLDDLNKNLLPQHKLKLVCIVDEIPKNAAGKADMKKIEKLLESSGLRKLA